MSSRQNAAILLQKQVKTLVFVEELSYDIFKRNLRIDKAKREVCRGRKRNIRMYAVLFFWKDYDFPYHRRIKGRKNVWKA